MTSDDLQQFFHAHVPLALAMGVEVREAAIGGVRLHFPLAPNLNHHGTAFGGSLSAAGILAGWSLLHVCLSAAGQHAGTVVADSRTRFVSPVEASFDAIALAPAAEQWEQFLDMLSRWGRARLELRTEIRPAGAADRSGAAVVHQGIYVAIARG